METRIFLEIKAVKLAALRRTEEDLNKIEKMLQAYKTKVTNGESAVQEDLLFHLAIAKATHNSMLNTFMLIITPKIITNFEKYYVCDKDKATMAIEEHTKIYEAIKNTNTVLAKKEMKYHFKELYKYCYNVEI